MPILASPLQLEGYYVQEFHFAVRQHPENPAPLFFQLGLHPQLNGLFDPADMTVNTRVGGGINNEEPNRIVVIVEVASRTAPEIKFPYDFRVVMAGYFRLDTEQPVEDREGAIHALRTTGASLLYAAARELIASVTGRGPFPAVVLPTVVIALDPMTEQEQPPTTKKGGRKATARKTAKKGRKTGKKS